MKIGKAVVFDMDGVIFDSERLVQESWALVAQRHGFTGVAEVCRQCLGLCQDDARLRFLAVYGDDFPYWEYKTECRDIYWNTLYEDHLPLKPGIRELLTALKNEGIPTAVASSTSRKTVTKELTDAGLIEYFDVIVCGDMVTRSKPDPEIYETACRLLDVAPADAWAIEDAPNGIRSAHAAGLMPIMVPDQIQPTAEIRALTRMVCTSLIEVRKNL